MILVKIGGGEHINTEYICEDIATLVQNGEKIVIIHGANFVRDELAEKLNIPTKIITSPSGVASVFTDENAIDVFLMSYAGLVNKKLVARLLKYGVNAVGLSGVDGRLLQAKKRDAIYGVENGKTKLITNSLTGKVEKVNGELLNLLINAGYVPVLCPPAISFENEILNIDNDFASAIVAGELGIEKIVMLFEAPGILENVEDENTLIKNIKKEELGEYLKFAKGRMKKKILGAEKSFALGVGQIYWGDGRIRNPIRNLLKGNGTIIE